MLNYNAFYYFLELCSAGSFTQAAENLHLTRSALSMSIKNLESQLGFTLFVRTHDGVSLTSEGKEVAQYAKIAFSAFKNIEQLAFKHIQPTDLIIYTDTGIGDRNLPYVISEYHKINPNGNISVHSIGCLTLEEIVSIDTEAIIFSTFEENYRFPASIEYVVLDKAPAVLAMGKDSPLLPPDINSISKKDIINLPLLSFSSGETQHFYNTMLSQINKFGVPNIVHTGDSLHMIHSLARHNIGVMFYPYFKTIINLTKSDYLRFVKIKNAPVFNLVICFDKNMNKDKTSFITNFFKNIYQSSY